ncbi:MAG: hypothetical protein DRI81_13505 [Chloroflexi bacterium]|nr:MAG: hypothetical protein DRI81_13505 [Chloroflexota bacterium]
MPDQIELKLFLNPTAQTDAEELERLTRQLRQDILDLEVEDVRPLEAAAAQAGAKSGFPVALGALLITTLASSNVLPPLIDLLKSVLEHHSLSSVMLEIDGDKIEVKGNPSRKQQELIKAWMSRHPLILTSGR